MLAALDLGSNSFHMVIAEQDRSGRLQIIDRVKEMVQLNAGLDPNGNLDRDSQQRALSCLERFSQRLRDIPAPQVRAVGTNTFRAAHNAAAFLDQAESVLGHHISIISGHEEARLVYLGAAFSLESSGNQRLVVDIGGGSTEIIIGRGYEAIQMNSLYMGCVSFSRRFFPNGKISNKRLQSARSAAMVELEPVIKGYRAMGWQEVVGTSGTIRAVDEVSRALGLNRDWLSKDSFELIDDWLIQNRRVEKLDFVSERRRSVFPGGYAIISAIFDALELTRLDCASGALREGVLYDLNGRLQDQDSRDSGVDALMGRFSLDRTQAARVKVTALTLLKMVGGPWNLNQVITQKLLVWASELHEIGTTIAFNQHHKHGGYIVENSDIDGFSRQQQRLLALLIRSHRQKFPLDLYQSLPQPTRQMLFYLAVLLRLSIAFNRGRSDIDLPEIGLEPGANRLGLRIVGGWSERNPLTVMDLQAEQDFLGQAGFHLDLDLT